MSARPTPSPESRAGIARWFTLVEDAVYLGLGLLLTCLVLVLLFSAFVSFGRSVVSWALPSTVIALLDQILLILLLAELLYTVKVSFREHSLVPEPFLLVGLISVIRRVLVLTAEFGEKHGEVTQIAIAELAVLGALILVLAYSLVQLRKHRASQTEPT